MTPFKSKRQSYREGEQIMAAWGEEGLALSEHRGTLEVTNYSVS